MQKRSKKIVSVIAILSLVIMTANLAIPAKAASIANASDLLSTSDRSAVATHTLTFTNKLAVNTTDYYNVVLPAAFGPIMSAAQVTCPGGGTATVINASTTAHCTGVAFATSTVNTLVITGVANPVVWGSQTIPVEHYDNLNNLRESSNVMVAITDHVTMTASVLSTLNFTISPLATTTSINGATTTAASATTTIAFGNLTVGYNHIIGQQLQVATNANFGYMVTVAQNQDLTSNTGATIHAFKDSAASTTAQAWSAPLGTLDVPTTYGHMGFTSDDATLSTNQFATSTWKGFVGTTPMEVMYHTGPADGLAQNKGLAKVAYQVQISALQAAGDYTNTLTYVATPIY